MAGKEFAYGGTVYLMTGEFVSYAQPGRLRGSGLSGDNFNAGVKVAIKVAAFITYKLGL